MAIGGGVPSTKGLPTVKAFNSFAPPQIDAAPSKAIGVPIQSGSAPIRITRVYYQTRSEPPYVAPVVSTPTGWASSLSIAPTVNAPTYDLGSVPFLTPPAVTIGWQTQLSVASVVAKATQTWTQVPYNTPQLSVNFTPLGWQGPLETAPRSIKAQSGFASFPYNQNTAITGWQSSLSVAALVAGVANPNYALPPYTAPAVINNTVTLDKWQPPLSIAPAVARAQFGFASVPFNTAQVVVTSPIGIPLFSGGAPPRTRPVYVQTLSQPPYAVPVALYGTPLDMGGALPQIRSLYYQSAFVPPYIAPVVVAAYTNLFLQPLSTAPSVAKAQAGFGSVPFNTAQAQPAGIAGMAWHTPLGTVPYRIAYGPQEFGYDAPRYGDIAPSPAGDTTRGSETILTDRRGAGGFSRKQYDEFLAAKRAALAKVKRLKKKPAAEELREAVAIASRAAGLLGDFSPSLEPVTEALRAAATADAAHAMQAAVDAVNAAQRLLRRIEDDEDDDEMLLLSI